MFRASFDALFHDFDFHFPNDGEALGYIRDFSGSHLVQSQAIHELTHFYYSISPVSRAIRALRNKALFVLFHSSELIRLKQSERINPTAYSQAINQWKIADAINQYLLPIYEGTALMAEFDCSLVPSPDRNYYMTFMDLQKEQCLAAIRNKNLFMQGFHSSVGYPDPEGGLLLDALSSHLLSPEIITRKKFLLNHPLLYDQPSECYLIAWLFVRQVHQRISAAIDENVSPLFVIKYLRSYFLEDWMLVDSILEIFYCRQVNTWSIIEHIQNRLAILSSNFTNEAYIAYRNGIDDAHIRGEQNFEFLPGLLHQVPIERCYEIGKNLQRASYIDFAPQDLDDIGVRIYGNLMSLQNRNSYIAIHKGSYLVEKNGSQISLNSGKEALLMNLANDEQLLPCRAWVTFHLACGGEVLQRIARIHLKDRAITAWYGGRRPGAAAFFGEMRIIEQSEAAAAYVAQNLEGIRKIFKDEFAQGVHEGCQTGRSIFLKWLQKEQKFYVALGALAQALGHNTPPRATFSRLFRPFFSEAEFDVLTRHSLAYGIGYNIGDLSMGSGRDKFLQGSNFKSEIHASYAIERKTGISNFHFFYCEDTPDGYQLPRYYF